MPFKQPLNDLRFALPGRETKTYCRDLNALIRSKYEIHSYIGGQTLLWTDSFSTISNLRGLAKEKGGRTLDPALNFSARNDTTNRKISNTQTRWWKGMKIIYTYFKNVVGENGEWQLSNGNARPKGTVVSIFGMQKQ